MCTMGRVLILFSDGKLNFREIALLSEFPKKRILIFFLIFKPTMNL